MRSVALGQFVVVFRIFYLFRAIRQARERSHALVTKKFDWVLCGGQKPYKSAPYSVFQKSGSAVSLSCLQNCKYACRYARIYRVQRVFSSSHKLIFFLERHIISSRLFQPFSILLQHTMCMLRSAFFHNRPNRIYRIRRFFHVFVLPVENDPRIKTGTYITVKRSISNGFTALQNSVLMRSTFRRLFCTFSVAYNSFPDFFPQILAIPF